MDKKKFGEFIKEARSAKNLTQAKLAEQLFIDVTAVSKWERGINYPDISMIKDICKCLDITESELIECSRDTEYRQMAYNSQKYLRNKKITFWSITGSFILAVVTCFICNLAVNHTLSWFFIVLTSCMCGYWAIMAPFFIHKIKKSTDEKTTKLISRLSMLIYSAGLLIFTILILVTVYFNSPFDLVMGLKITVYCFLLLLLYGVVELFSFNRSVKLGVDFLITELFALSLVKVLPALMNIKETTSYAIDFKDWVGHSNGNVSLIIATVLSIAGVVLIISGIKKGR